MSYATYIQQAGHRVRATMTLMIVCTALAMLILLPQAGFAQGSVRAGAMGGAYLGAARGLDAVEWNPANLAFSPGVTIGLASAAADISNNSFSLARYNEITGKTLNDADKNRILADIPEEGFAFDTDVRASAFGLQIGRFALSAQGIGVGQGRLDRDFFELILFGNEINETVSFDNTNGFGYALGSATLSTGHPVAETRFGRLSVGGNVRYLYGVYDAHVENASGAFTTEMDDISGQADVSVVTAAGGAGYGLDLGVALQASRGWTFGLAMDNVFSSIGWNKDPERTEFMITAEDINMVTEDFDNAVVDSDSTYAIDSYSTTLPRRVRLGASNTYGSLLFAVDYIQSFASDYTVSTTPQLATGVEWRPIGVLHPRFGLSAGGRFGKSIAGGLGINLGPLCMDLSVINRGGYLPGDLRGLAFGFGSSLEF